MSEREYIDVTPTWTAIMPGMIRVLQAGNAEGIRNITEELMRLAKAVDDANKESADAED